MHRTRENMEAILRTGASVMLPGGGVATTVDQLPSKTTLARWDAEEAERIARQGAGDQAVMRLAADMQKSAQEREDRAKAELQARIAELQAQLVAAEKPAAPTPAPAPPAPAAPPAPPAAAPAAAAPAPAKAAEKK